MNYCIGVLFQVQVYISFYHDLTYDTNAFIRSVIMNCKMQGYVPLNPYVAHKFPRDPVVQASSSSSFSSSSSSSS